MQEGRTFERGAQRDGGRLRCLGVRTWGLVRFKINLFVRQNAAFRVGFRDVVPLPFLGPRVAVVVRETPTHVDHVEVRDNRLAPAPLVGPVSKNTTTEKIVPIGNHLLLAVRQALAWGAARACRIGCGQPRNIRGGISKRGSGRITKTKCIKRRITLRTI